MGNDFSVRLGYEGIFFREDRFNFLVIIDNTVVYYGDLSLIVAMGVGIVPGYSAMSCPADMSNTDLSG